MLPIKLETDWSYETGKGSIGALDYYKVDIIKKIFRVWLIYRCKVKACKKRKNVGGGGGEGVECMR